MGGVLSIVFSGGGSGSGLIATDGRGTSDTKPRLYKDAQVQTAADEDHPPLAFVGRRAPVNRLPFELLTQIFLLYAPYTAVDPSEKHPGCLAVAVHIKHWALISHVCKYWRSIALDFPLAWSQLVITRNADWATELLTRSKDVPLDILVLPQDSSSTQSPACQLVRKELHRTRTLHFERCAWATRRRFNSLCTVAPLLECLYITSDSVTKSREEYMNELLDDVSTLSKSVPSVGPRAGLRRLEVHGCDKGPMHLGRSASTLRHLSVSGGGLLLSIHLGVLWSASNRGDLPLETLDLEVKLNQTDSSNFEAPMHTPSYLPHLRELRVKAKYRDCATLLNFLDLADLTKLTVEAITSRRLGSEEAFAAALYPKLAALGPLSALRLYRDVSRDPLAICVEGLDESSTTKFTLVLSQDLALVRAADGLLAVLARCRAAFKSVRRLYFKDIMLPFPAWIRVFSFFRNVEGLDISGKSTIIALTMHPNERDREHPEVLVFPACDARGARDALDTTTAHACTDSRPAGATEPFGVLVGVPVERTAWARGDGAVPVVCPKENRNPRDMALLRRSVPMVAWDEDDQAEGNWRGSAAETRTGWDPLGVLPQEQQVFGLNHLSIKTSCSL
ncbi:uncharacterized protein B0H18DRAFT_1114039 [Fomitopsis serialis]|uniref:uncharacterized protein n=1 Tax=Fomitopsis serialis TaxID=139415 RepID=UPI0020080021|nr:uncharacterized protein B0H18DRAFT_1114039 [Neoantrodia serialis]KAH9936683.1 hypothetical protein B0H18DRAFT_1114039 [Neoantrodia serialis]